MGLAPVVMSSLISAGGGLLGGLFNRGASRRANRTNVMLARETNDFNAAEAEKGRKFVSQQSAIQRAFDLENAREARRWNVRQVLDARRWDRQQVLDTERRQHARSRADVAADRADHREYNDPAQVRARLEAAGINPLSGVDNSGAYIAPTVTGGGAAQSGIAHAAAVSSGGVSGSAIAQGVAATVQPSNIGTYIADAAGHIGGALMAQHEESLRMTQLEEDNRRLERVLNRATLRPVVPGVYGPSYGPASSLSFDNTGVLPSGRSGRPDLGPVHQGSGDPASGFARRGDPRREYEIAPHISSDALMSVDQPGILPFYVPSLNGEPLDAGQAALAGGSYAAQHPRDFGRKVARGVVSFPRWAGRAYGGFTRGMTDGVISALGGDPQAMRDNRRTVNPRHSRHYARYWVRDLARRAGRASEQFLTERREGRVRRGQSSIRW